MSTKDMILQKGERKLSHTKRRVQVLQNEKKKPLNTSEKAEGITRLNGRPETQSATLFVMADLSNFLAKYAGIQNLKDIIQTTAAH